MRIFKLIGMELAFLWRTVALIGLILIAFVSALLSVVSVLLDVPDGIYTGLDEYSSVYSLTVTAPQAGLAAAGGTPRYGHINGITRYAVIEGPESSINTTVHTAASADEEDRQEQDVSISVTCYAVVGEGAEEFFAPYVSSNQAYAFPKAAGEVALNKSFAEIIGAKIGDTVTFSPDRYFMGPEWDLALENVAPQTFRLVGYVDTTAIGNYNTAHPGEAGLPAAHAYFIAPPDAGFSTLTFLFSHSKEMHSAYLGLQRAGVKSAMSSASFINSIGIAQAFFAALALVLGAMVVFMLYALISIFYRQRRSQICRLKLLGAQSGVIAATYCSIAIALVLVAVLLGSLFSMAFNVYFIGLCGRLFKRFSANFVSHFRPVIPLGVFAALILVTLLLYLHFNRKVKNAAIAQEVRHE